MKFSVTKATLSAVVERAQGCISGQPVTDSMKHYYIQVKEGVLTVKSMDIDLSFVGRTEAVQIEEDGGLCLPAAKINDIVKASTGTIKFASKSDELTALIGCKGASWKIHGLSLSDFPECREFVNEEMINVDRKQLLAGMRAVRHAVSTEETRANMLMIGVTDGSMRAADGRRIAIYDVTGLPDIRIPAPAVEELCRLLAMSGSSQIRIEDAKGSVVFGIGDDIFASRQLNAAFVDLSHIMKKAEDDAILSIVITKEELIKALERVAITVGKKGKVMLQGEGKELFVSSEDEMGNKSKAKLKLAAETEGKMGANIGFMLEAVKVIDMDKLTLNYGAQSNVPIVIKGKKVLCLVLQTRM